MILSLNIPDEKTPFIMELLRGFPYVETTLKTANATPNELIDKHIDISKHIKPLRNFTIEDLVKEQNYQGFDMAKFRVLADIIDIKNEPIDELLDCIK